MTELEQELLQVFTDTFGLDNRLVDPQTYKQKQEKGVVDWDTITLHNKLFTSVRFSLSQDNVTVFRFLFEKADREAILLKLKCFIPYDPDNTLEEEIENHKQAIEANDQNHNYTVNKGLGTGYTFLYYRFGLERFLDLAVSE